MLLGSPRKGGFFLGDQLLWPVVAMNEAGLHAVAAVARSGQYEPAGQSMHAVSPLVV